ncbi:hypothetical protein [Embleya hyalina]|uniref:Uncharacterized protein n=1 Tax=Embleya hyalina TaxID=516124 RepID=A0A401YGG4_9ACTN|nr:hypothetical protein [Embleya hyalina]GCD93704.1 hypothetical protein EHYA_01349 [Embleya hyalina]
MNHTRSFTRGVLATALVATMVGATAPAVAAGSATKACAWTPAVLPMPAGALAGDVSATDGSGGYAGTISYGANSAQGSRATLWKNGKLTDYGYLNVPGYQKWVEVLGVDKAGTVVANAFRNGGPSSAVRSRDAGLERLPEPPGVSASRATGINDHGDIVGAVDVGTGGASYWRAVIWPADKPGTVVELNGLPDGEGYATGIDQDGTVLVEVDKDFSRRPYLWKAGRARAARLPAGATDVLTRGISNGRIIGQVTYRSGNGAPSVLWDRDGVPRAVSRAADVTGINRDGRIVGRTDDPDWHEFGVWRSSALEATLSYAPDRGLEFAVAGDDGTIAGRSWKIPGGRDEPTVWTCR